jgi:hypothetical protein
MKKGMQQSLTPPQIEFSRKSSAAFGKSSSPARALSMLKGGEVGSEARVGKWPSRVDEGRHRCIRTTRTMDWRGR